MALNRNNGTNKNDSRTTPQEPQYVNQQNTPHSGDKTSTPSIGFSSGLRRMRTTSTGGDIQEFVRIVSEAHRALDPNHGNKLSIFDPSVIPSLSYTYVVTSCEVNDEVIYHITMFADTGPAPLTVNEINAKVAASVNSRHNETPDIYTPDSAINGNLRSIVKERLQGMYKPGVAFVGVSGLTVYDSSDIVTVATAAAPVIWNAIEVEGVVGTGQKADLNISHAMAETKGTLQLDANLYPTGTVVNPFGMPRRTDWELVVNIVNNQNTSTVFNVPDSRQELTRVSGFIDAIPQEVTVPAPYGADPRMVTKQVRLNPHIIITSNEPAAKSTGYMLLGLISALSMAVPSMWIGALANRPPKTLNSVDVLNIITNVDNDPKGGIAFDFANGVDSKEETYQHILNLFSGTPVISYDIENNGDQSSYSSIIAACVSKDPVIAADARKELIEAAHNLTNGSFPLDFPADKLFVANESTVIPLGIYHDNSGPNDMRNIDLAAIASTTGDIGVINKFAYTNLPPSISGRDPFLDKCKFTGDVAPNPTVLGKANRVMLTDVFAATLSEAAALAGYSTPHIPDIVLTTNPEQSTINDYLSNAGVSNVPTFSERTPGSYNPNISANWNDTEWRRRR